MHVDVFGRSSVHLYEFNVMDHAKSVGPTMLPLSPSEPKGVPSWLRTYMLQCYCTDLFCQWLNCFDIIFIEMCFSANVTSCSVVVISRYPVHCPLHAEGTLKWLGYSASGVLASYDSAGVLRVAPSTNRTHWVPVLNTSKVCCTKQLVQSCLAPC